MDQTSLKTASDYINNLLLARGLLRNGTPVEFMQLARKKEESNAALGQVINLVHDLILRRDRDQTQHEDLASSLRSLQNEAQNNHSNADRLVARNKDLERQLALVQAQARNAQSGLYTAEASARSLRDEMAKVKSLLVQVRKQCENDVRKRDIQIQRLKTHLSAQQRGGSNKTTVVGPSITIKPGANARRDASRSAGNDGLGHEEEYPSLEDAEYSLKQETTEFLTQLSQGLSDENDSLLNLVRSTIATLKELQGIQQQATTHAQSLGDQGDGDSMVQIVPTSYGELANDLEAVLANLRDLLTNPSFAPIEEVQLREEEILRLRAGWEKMESRWQEAVGMMDGWRKRMLSGGVTVNLEELKMGLGLGKGLEALGTAKGPILSNENDDTDDESPAIENGEPHIDNLAEGLPSDEEDAIPEDPAGNALFDLSGDPSLQERDLNINLGPMVTTRDRKPSVHASSKGARKTSHQTSGTTTSKQHAASLKRARTSATAVDSHHNTPRKQQLHHARPPSPSSPAPLTVPEKLALAAAQARRVSSQASASNCSSPLDLGGSGPASPVGASPVKRTRITGRPVRAASAAQQRGSRRRRKSTLSPEELEGLLVAGGVF